MTTFAVSMVKDEGDIIVDSVGRMAGQVDAMIIADNGSTDGTREALDWLAREYPLTVVDDPDPAYYQSQKMSRLARRAADEGAEWVVPFDADERWYSPFGRIADVLAERTEAVVAAQLFDHVATGQDPTGWPMDTMGWRRVDPAPLAKVAFRPVLRAVVHQGNHGVSYPEGGTDGLVVRHFPYRSAAQMVRKARNGAAAYAATDLPEDAGKHWRDYGRLTDEQIGDVFREYFWAADPVRAGLIFDPAPA